jgi:hypothetical protein
MRASVLLWLLVGCDAATETDAGGPDACEPTLGVLEVCIYGDATSTEPMGGTVTARRTPTDVPWIMRSGDDGCTRELVEIGAWEVQASDTSGTCTAPFSTIEIRSCEVTTVRSEVNMWCVDG